MYALPERGAMSQNTEQLNDVISQFQFQGNLIDYAAYGNGHINDTYCVRYEAQGKEKRYILQRMNHHIFKNPKQLMENVIGVTSWLRKKIVEQGGDPERETLQLVPLKNGDLYYCSEDGNYFRAYYFIEESFCFDKVEKPKDFYESALAFGHFQRLLADYPAEQLHETIPDFHNTIDRFAKFKKALEEDVMGRAKEVQKEIAFVLEREAFASVLMDLLKEKKLPLRVTHNDTKLNNIMIDRETGKGICVIDLDTVMPGLAVNDFGDSIRFGASTGAEDEINLDKISCDLSLFECYVKGFLEGCNKSLTKTEVEMLPTGAKMMTFECGMRFLTDYLQGDTYFKIHREGHNLDRCRTQFKLVQDMEAKWDQMHQIVKQYS